MACERLPGRRSPRRQGFTFAEVLAAMLFMAIVIPAAVEGVLIANRMGVVSERKRRAAELADSKLTDIVVTDEWRLYPKQEGDFGDDWPGFRWALETDAWVNDTMQVVTVTVFYNVQGREYSVRLSTLAVTQEQA